jgi:serine/threonine protein kinase
MLVGCPPFIGDDDEEIFDSIVHDEVVFPKYLTFESTVLMRRLLRKDPTKRLGSSVRDAADVKKHSFFRTIDFDELYARQLPPPFLPSVMYGEDVSNFDYEFTSRDARLSRSKIQGRLVDRDQMQFEHFDYVCDEWAAQLSVKPPNSDQDPKPFRVRPQISEIKDDLDANNSTDPLV